MMDDLQSNDCAPTLHDKAAHARRFAVAADVFGGGFAGGLCFVL
jgi:hypothetical protein